MSEFWTTMTATWWGITIICVVSVALWIILSALLYKQFFKRFYDIVLSGLAIIVLSWLLLILTVVGAIVMRGDPFFTQARPGRIDRKTGKEKIFKLIKFRTMTCQRDDKGELLPDEERLTGYGKFLRASSLDELPELFNILIGQMAIVGPRPLLVQYLPLYSEQQRHRHDVRPGLTGLAQVNGRNAISWEDKFSFDLAYIEKITIWRDIKIILMTVIKIFKRSGISQEGQATMEDFMGSNNNRPLQTPYYVISSKLLDDNIETFRKALALHWSNSVIAYSVKTNSLPWILKHMLEQGLYAEVVSDEEYLLAKKCGFGDDRIIFNGPVKGERLFEQAIKNGAVINLDSAKDLEYLEKYNTEKDVIGIRINVDPKFFNADDTSFMQDGFRFGFSDEGGNLSVALDTVRKIYGRKKIGLHFHCNSSTRSVEVYRSISKYAAHLIKKYSIDVDYIDIGGGFFGGVEGKPNALNYIDVIKSELENVVDINSTRLIVEPGSAIVGSAVDLHTSVLDVKDTVCSRIVTTDGSRLHVDPLWKKHSYLYSIETAKSETIKKQILCGYTCMDYDRIMTLSDERELSVGDKVIYKRVGSYTMTFGGMFIRYLPAVYVDNGTQLEIVRTPITVDDYYRIHS